MFIIINKLNLHSIKHENIIRIFNTITTYHTKISRADIAAESDLSIMTVGKVVDAFITSGILTQSKEIKGSAGRKAGLVMLNSERISFIIDLTSYNFSFTVINFRLSPEDKIVYSYNKDYSYHQNLIIFLRNMKIYLDKKSVPDSDFYGIGVILPGRYNTNSDSVINSFIPELNNINVKSMIENITGYDIALIDSDIDAAAKSIINTQRYRTEHENVILHISLNDQNHIRSSVIFNGSVMYNLSHTSGNIGDIYVGHNVSLQSMLYERQKIDDCIQEFCHVFHNIINLLTPDVVAIECDTLKISPDVKPKITGQLIENYKVNKHLIPEIFICNNEIRHSTRGVAIKLREIWFEKLL